MAFYTGRHDYDTHCLHPFSAPTWPPFRADDEFTWTANYDPADTYRRNLLIPEDWQTDAYETQYVRPLPHRPYRDGAGAYGYNTWKNGTAHERYRSPRMGNYGFDRSGRGNGTTNQRHRPGFYPYTLWHDIQTDTSRQPTPQQPTTTSEEPYTVEEPASNNEQANPAPPLRNAPDRPQSPHSSASSDHRCETIHSSPSPSPPPQHATSPRPMPTPSSRFRPSSPTATAQQPPNPTSRAMEFALACKKLRRWHGDLVRQKRYLERRDRVQDRREKLLNRKEREMEAKLGGRECWEVVEETDDGFRWKGFGVGPFWESD